ncbi:KAP family NTPase [Bradyrhizobium sp. SZCCHNR1098]|uniref:KAP family P-loop NTPase fold protein n=1 Tax=Bradyrhizobium sp. SZCCHNR1098 TaxID=3057370 RepID=UPI002916E3C4|nr:KAP family NTPase [Bradyrhizobium sp. SZCCHNR1098]
MTDAHAKDHSEAPGRPERPIDSQEQDVLGRMNFVRRLADALIDKKTGKSRGIAIGITGPWGSGKSSILNLLREHLKASFPKAVVVRFDPWLISGRTDLIAEFIRELIRTIGTESWASAQLKKVGDTFAVYGDYIAPIATLANPIFGTLLRGGASAYKEHAKNRESLSALKSRLMKELVALDVPIVALIDELDRVEDEEIRTIAQLVRSVADFPGISYVLAYDQKRVVQALGVGQSGANAEERGRAYLEKIVQLQIPLPTIFANEISELLTGEIRALKDELELPDQFEDLDRYRELLKLLSEQVLDTPRDVSRLIGTFHAIAGMLRDEVDWIDLLGFTALLTKAPQAVELLRSSPDDFTQEIFSEAAIVRRIINRLDKNEEKKEERINRLLPAEEYSDGIRALVGFMFPVVSIRASGTSGNENRPDAIYHRRPFLTTMRLGLPPGEYSRTSILAFIAASPRAAADILRTAYDARSIRAFIDRFDDIYAQTPDVDHVNLWLGIALFAKKPDCEWMRSYNPMHEILQKLSDILMDRVKRDPAFKETATKIFVNLKSQGDGVLTALWLRRHISGYGLYEQEKQQEKALFLTAEQTEAMTKDLSHGWRTEHLSGRLIPCRWDLMPIYTMINTGIWDEPCRKALDEQLEKSEAVDGLTLMLYGSIYSTEKEIVAKICDYENYRSKVKSRLANEDLDLTVRAALNKALGKRG